MKKIILSQHARDRISERAGIPKRAVTKWIRDVSPIETDSPADSWAKSATKAQRRDNLSSVRHGDFALVLAEEENGFVLLTILDIPRYLVRSLRPSRRRRRHLRPRQPKETT